MTELVRTEVHNRTSVITLNRSELDGKTLDSRSLSSVTEYQNLISTLNSVAYSIEITRLR